MRAIVIFIIDFTALKAIDLYYKNHSLYPYIFTKTGVVYSMKSLLTFSYFNVLVSNFFIVTALSAQPDPETISVNGTLREYIIEIPNTYSDDSPHSLVLVYHGMTSNASQAWNYSFHFFGSENNFITIYPQGLADIDNVFVPGAYTTGWKFETTGNRDVSFTQELIEQLSDEYSILPNNIFVTGMSNGGFISNIIGCNLGDEIAAIAPEVGGIIQSIFIGCPVSNPLPVMTLGSEFDAVVDIQNLRDATSFWTEHNETAASPTTQEFCDIYTGPHVRSEVRHCEFDCLTNGSSATTNNTACHTWPSSYNGYAFEATTMIIDFFNDHGLGKSPQPISSSELIISSSHSSSSVESSSTIETYSSAIFEISSEETTSASSQTSFEQSSSDGSMQSSSLRSNTNTSPLHNHETHQTGIILVESGTSIDQQYIPVTASHYSLYTIQGEILKKAVIPSHSIQLPKYSSHQLLVITFH